VGEVPAGGPSLRVDLCHLKRFFLEEISLETARYLLSSVIFPPAAGITLGLRNAMIITTFPSPSVVDYETTFQNIPRVKWLIVISMHHPLMGDVFTMSAEETLGGTEAVRLEFSCMKSNTIMGAFTSLETLPMPLLENVFLKGFNQPATTTTHFSRFFATFPTIKFLWLEGQATRRIDALVFTPDSHLCPLLESLRIHDSDIREETLIRLVKSRNTTRDARLEGDGGVQPSHLTTLTLHKCIYVSRAAVSVLAGLGVKVGCIGVI